MTLWDHLPPEALPAAAALPGHGARVAKVGTVSFVRSGFARVHWDDGTQSDEWAADLVEGPDAR